MAEATTSTRGRDPETIRRDIESTREDMDETVAALGDRLSPGRLVDEAWERIRASDGAGIGTIVREHPVPIALMGLGLAWLAIEQSRSHAEPRRRTAGTLAPAEGRRGPYGPDAVDHDDPDWEHNDRGIMDRAGDKARGLGRRASHAASSVKEKAGEAASAMREKAADAAHAVKEKAHLGEHDGERTDGYGSDGQGVKEKARDAAERVRHTARRTRDETVDGFWHMLEDNPLALGAITFGLGLASGLAAPTTRVESRKLGPAAEAVKDEVERVGKETVHKAKRVAQDATGAALDEAHRQVEETTSEGGGVREAAGDLAHEAKAAAKNVGRAAKDAAAESAEREDLTAEGMKREAKKASQRARSGAKAHGGGSDPSGRPQP